MQKTYIKPVSPAHAQSARTGRRWTGRRAVKDDIGKSKATFPESRANSSISFQAIRLREVVPGAQQLHGADLRIGTTEAGEESAETTRNTSTTTFQDETQNSQDKSHESR